MKINLSEYKEVWKALAWFIAAIVACRFVGGIVILAIVLVAIVLPSMSNISMLVFCPLKLYRLIVSSSLNGLG